MPHWQQVAAVEEPHDMCVAMLHKVVAQFLLPAICTYRQGRVWSTWMNWASHTATYDSKHSD
eukprot:CAMPEP_0172742680 /NCGR_PEP_ID=MMETSP1074-20121228/130188_1 /TAXON_ID=2916 /ORGANISM="Ceratium fusus, Strain PA161109" /LENGTH=61 /DNA_ID=CAMNT_0013573277 /DNA_START=740 /DNA_END=925 /DNA_ORIENTATION=+